MTTSEPESVDVGDLITVIHEPDELGITRHITGRVHRRGDAGSFRTLYTEQGGEIVTWNRSKRRLKFKVYVVQKAPVEQEPLSIFNELSR